MSSKKRKSAKKKQAKKSKSKTAKKAKAKKAKSMSRLEASVHTLNRIPVDGKVKYESAVEKADAFYCDQPGNADKSNMKEAGYAMSKASKVFELLGLVSIEDGVGKCLRKVG